MSLALGTLIVFSLWYCKLISPPPPTPTKTCCFLIRPVPNLKTFGWHLSGTEC